MSDEDLDISDVFTNFSYKFTAIQVVDNRIVPVSFRIRADIAYYQADEDDKMYDYNLRVAMEKVRYWFNNVLTGSIMIGRNNEWGVMNLIHNDLGPVANTLVMLPEDPDNATLAQVLQCKMNALGGGFVRFGITELSNEDGLGLTVIYTGDSELGLPDMEEWIGERSFFSKPWWARNDASTYDTVPEDDEDITKPPAYAKNLNFIGDLMGTPPHEAANMVRPEFRPQVIPGGKA